MAYATLDDVQRRMPQFTLTGVSLPNTDAAQLFLDAVHAEFDSAVENLGYRTPLTGSKSLAQAKEIVSQGCIAKILFARAAAIGTDVAVKSAERAQGQYDKALERLADPESPVELTDASRTGDEVEKPGIEPLGLTADVVSGDPIEPRFTMDFKF